MKKSSTLFLKIILLIIALVSLLFLIYFPQTEGRAKDLQLLEIYADPLILYSYIASIPFFLGLFEAFRMLILIDKNRAFSKEAVDSLRKIKLLSFIQVGLVVLGLIYIRFYAHGDDSAGPSALGLLACIAFSVIGTTAALFQKLLQNAVDIKSENDLTV